MLTSWEQVGGTHILGAWLAEAEERQGGPRMPTRRWNSESESGLLGSVVGNALYIA